MSAKEQVKKEIIEAYVFLRTNNITIPSETLEFMKDSSLKALDQALTTPVVSKCDCDKDIACIVCGEEKGLDGDYWKRMKEQ